jgi:mannan endo-1,4-beta-mannosidase
MMVFVNKGKLFDANGNEFLIRGINSAHADWDNWNRFWAYNSIPSIANTGTNLIRILWRMNLQGGLTRDDLEKIILRCIQYKIVPMIEIHDATGSHNREDLLNCARWFKNNVDLLNKYQKYIIVNIANEWVSAK